MRRLYLASPIDVKEWSKRAIRLEAMHKLLQGPTNRVFATLNRVLATPNRVLAKHKWVLAILNRVLATPRLAAVEPPSVYP